MGRIPALGLCLLLATSALADRVKTARENRLTDIKALFAEKKIAYPPARIFLRAFKRDRALELWARGAKDEAFQLVKTFKICALSGDLGPKRRSGDGQIPEGFYSISGFNPASAYHLSLRVDYPNASDKKLGAAGNLGGDIFIHGSCVTIGCLPLKDEGIEELYVIALDAGRPIPVHIFPTKLKEQGMKELSLEYASRPKLLAFWKNLKEGYDRFEADHRMPAVSVGDDGSYRFR